jgi:integrase/recombinase XerD
MTGLREAAENYLVMRRTLGFKLVGEGRLVMRLVDYCESRAADHLTTELALAWAIEPGPRGQASEYYQSRKLMVARIFARHLKMLDPATEIPPEDLLPCRARTLTPYLYSDSEITALMDAAASLTPPLRAATWRTIIGLLAVTGMRSGEACRLDREHVDLGNATVLVDNSKFGKSRQLFLHPSTVTALRGYVACRDRYCPAPATSAFFVSHRGNRLNVAQIAPTFAALVDVAGITVGPRRRPRPRDLRHSFAVTTLLGLHHDGAPVQPRLPLLSTWLGHVDPKSTYWYLQAAPELLARAAERLEGQPGGLS